ncbi:putative polysaccharide export protein [Aspergillus steynii IBT 23096]|uniref:Putative polysaccharide export protein n=1 Tax=Aspergillus steynii IBT 23096 TaxID=1392250 RepID=A0A2I2GL49_9EURO|nr:putative polysaccharide export protein [Aspergillus steynii IBT 23096]PLB53605.1 putative polysaccharide export protein [Aspergillus steynii IBT 23096]
MLWSAPPLHRSARCPTLWRRLLQLFAGVVVAASLWEALGVHHQFRPSLDIPVDQPSPRGRIYIASIQTNTEALLRRHWNHAVVELARTLGPDNVFVSVLESASEDDTQDTLQDLDHGLHRFGIARNITLGFPTLNEDSRTAAKEHGWVADAHQNQKQRRIPYLARRRNASLQPFYSLLADGITFDRILFLEDVVFSTADVLRLLDTNGGDYAAACALDFFQPPRYHDAGALRDSQGHRPIMSTWPLFRAADSRRAMQILSPVPVASCWNGMVVMPAHPFMAETPLRFRGIADHLAAARLEGSERCLLHADNPLSATRGVYVNPRVRVAYSGTAYAAVQPVRNWLSFWHVLGSLWESRLRRGLAIPSPTEWRIRRRLARWESRSTSNREPGGFCLLDQSQEFLLSGDAHS